MKKLCSSTYPLLLLFFILSCDDQMGIVEILSLSASDSTVRIGKEIIVNFIKKFYEVYHIVYLYIFCINLWFVLTSTIFSYLKTRKKKK